MGELFGTARRGLGGLRSRPVPSAVPNVTAHPSTASVPITVLLYDGPLLCGFNVAIKGLTKLEKWSCVRARNHTQPKVTLFQRIAFTTFFVNVTCVSSEKAWLAEKLDVKQMWSSSTTRPLKIMSSMSNCAAYIIICIPYSLLNSKHSTTAHRHVHGWRIGLVVTRWPRST